MQDSSQNYGGSGLNPAHSTNTSSLNTTNPSADISMKKQKTLDDYELINQPNKSNSDLGKGSFGQVKLVRDKADPKTQYALKIINKKELMAASSIDHLKREIKIQKKLDHPHIIRLYHYFEDKDNVYLILEYAKNGNLFFYLRKKKTLTEKEAFVYFFQTCVGIDYLHKKGILHRDLKPENLLLDAKGNIKVCDFGWSAEDVGKRNTFCGTVDYMAPEMIQSQVHDFKIDIWSLGILLFELLHGHPPFQGKTADEKFQNILTKEIKFKDGLTNEVKELLSALLRSDPNQRPAFDWIFNHPWIQKFEKEFGISVKSFVYDASKKKDKKTGKTTPRDQSPVPKTTPTKETTPTKPVSPKPVESANQIKTQPFSTDINPATRAQPQISTQTPKVESLPQPFSTTSLGKPDTPQLDFKMPSLNTWEQKDLSNAYLSSSSQISSSSAAGRTNMAQNVSKPSEVHSGSPMKGVNKAQELIQGIGLPNQERPKSPARAGIFSSSNNAYDGSSFSNPNNRARGEGYSSMNIVNEKYGNLKLDSSPASSTANLPEKNLTPQHQSNTSLGSSNYLAKSPKDQFGSAPQENRFMTPKEQEKKLGFNTPSNYGGITTPVNQIKSPSSQYTSQTIGYEQRNYNTAPDMNPKSPIQRLTQEKDTRLPQSTAPGDVDFFVPKAENIESTLVKLASGSKSKSPSYSSAIDASSYPVHGGFETQQNDHVRMTRVTNLLQKGSFSDVDQIMEKFMKNDEKPHQQMNYKPIEKVHNDVPYKPAAQDHGRTADHGRVTTDHGRVTNIDKYLANYELDNTEENMLLDRLDNFYSTGSLQTEKERYPKREQPEQKRDTQNKPEDIMNRAAEIARKEELERSQATSQKINSAEMSFRDDSLKFEAPGAKRNPKVEMSFADAPRESEQYSVKNNFGKEEKRSGIYDQHIKEENEEEDYYEKGARKQTSEKKPIDARQKERERREETQINYNYQEQRRPEYNENRYEDQRRPEYNENRYEDQRQQVTGSKRRDYEYQQQGAPDQFNRSLGYSSSKKSDKREDVSPYGSRDVDEKKKSGFLTRVIEQEKKEVSPFRLNQKIHSYGPGSSNRDAPNLDYQREDVMKKYRNRLNGLYHFNSEMTLNVEGIEGHYDLNQNRNSGNIPEHNYSYSQPRDDRSLNSTYEQEQVERERRFGRHNEKPSQSFQSQPDDRYNPKRRKEDFATDEFGRRRQDLTTDPGYYSNYSNYSNKSSIQTPKSIDFNYEEMRKKRSQFDYMDDLNLDEEEMVSRPSWRNQREIPMNYGRNEPKKPQGLIEKISSLFGCLDRTEKQPVKTRKGRRAY